MRIAGVTGASGVVGSHIVRQLTAEGMHVRALSRQEHPAEGNVEYIKGDLEDESALERLVEGARYLFHCAGERRTPARMHDVNVKGTRRLVRIAGKSNLEYFCHLSSAGVVGMTQLTIIDESCKCRPQNIYEKTKKEAEEALLDGIEGCRVAILRPTNVVAEKDHGILAPIFHRTFKNRLKLRITGGERSHFVDVENVAAAAIHLMGVDAINPEVYFVSTDHEPNTHLHEIAMLHRFNRSSGTPTATQQWHLPIVIPYLLRKFTRGGGNKGNLVYSSQKLISTGFRYPVSVSDTIHRISSAYPNSI